MQSEGQVTELRQRFTCLNSNKGQEVNDSVARLISTYWDKFPAQKNHQLQQSSNGLLSVHSCPTVVHLPERTFLIQIPTKIPSMAIHGMAHHHTICLYLALQAHLLFFSILLLVLATLVLFWCLGHSKRCSCLSALSSVIPLDCVPVLCCCITDYLTV